MERMGRIEAAGICASGRTASVCRLEGLLASHPSPGIAGPAGDGIRS